MKLRFLTFFIIAIFGIQNISYSQLFPRFSIAGGPTIGWQFQNTDALNEQMQQIGLPAFPSDGFLTLGGGGFIELPVKGLTSLRLGGSGTGFTYERNTVTSDNITKTVYYSYGSGGITAEYVLPVSKAFEFTGGLYLSTGNLTLQLYQSTPDFGNWNSIFNEFGNSTATQNTSTKLSVRFYSVQPTIGAGVFITSFMYAKLNAGYMFGWNGDWYADNDVKVYNAPSGIEANGFNINFGLNFGLFTK